MLNNHQLQLKVRELERKLNSLSKMNGDGLVNVNRAGDGMSLKLNLQGLRSRIAKSGGGGGGTTIAKAQVVKDLKYDDPDRVYPDGNQWTDCTDGDPWPLENQDAYIVRLSTDSTDTYSEIETYTTGDYCLHEITADSIINEGTEDATADAADIGYGYILKWKCTVTEGESTTGTWKYADWELVDAYAEGQWKINTVYDSSAEHGRTVGEEDDMRNYTPWFAVDSEVPIISVGGVNIIFAVMNYLGEEGERSVAWNQDEYRLMSVYK